MPAGDTSVCHGNGNVHCCWFSGTVCPHLRDDGPQPAGGRRWVCSLFEEYRASSPGGWNDQRVWRDVHDDARYLADVEPLWRAASWIFDWLWQEGVRCGNWPDSLRGLTVTPGDPQYAEKQAMIQKAIADWQDMQTNGVQWPKFSIYCCFGGLPEEPV